eukprot:2576318-Prymnesium_polylepis.1
MARDTRRLPHAEYLALAMSHRFCLVAPGDYPSTHKITEAMALGGAGGCIPVFVLPVDTRRARALRKGEKIESAVARNLPFTRWLDYCDVAYLVTEGAAASDFSSAIAKLRAIPEAEAASKLAALHAVRDAFVFRPASSGVPTAADYILSEACDAAGRTAQPRDGGGVHDEHGSPPIVGGNHMRCLLA